MWVTRGESIFRGRPQEIGKTMGLCGGIKGSACKPNEIVMEVHLVSTQEAGAFIMDNESSLQVGDLSKALLQGLLNISNEFD
ncbi:hypothetical protein AgCh_039869 [Apium graveolens]